MFGNQLINELKLGNPEAFKVAFRLLYPRLKGYCKLFVHNKNQVEDIIQETFIALWDNRQSIQPEKSVESLVFVMLRNRCLNYLKKQNKLKDNIEIDNLKLNELQFLYQLDFLDNEDQSMHDLLLESFRGAVDELPEKMRIVFKKCKIEGQKQKQVADELGISVKMVEKHVATAKLKIREKLIN